MKTVSSHARKSGAAAILGLLWLVSFSGCVTVYQPMTGLQRPVAVDPNQPNLAGSTLALACETGGYLEPDDTTRLCKHLRLVFERQGAKVVNVVSGKFSDISKTPAELTVNVKPRLLHSDTSALWVLLSVASFTLVPMVSEFEFAQDVTVRDASGALLISDTLEARFIRYAGIGMWGLTGLLDWLVRPTDEAQGGNAFKESFTRDFQNQLSQVVFHGRMRAAVLHEFDPAKTPTVSAP